MTSLTEQTCEPCEGGVKPMDAGESREYLENVDGWSLLEKEVLKIQKAYEFEGFNEAIEFVNDAADIAENEGHHPLIEINYNVVTMTVWTHAIDGLSENDFILAAKFDEAVTGS